MLVSFVHLRSLVVFNTKKNIMFLHRWEDFSSCSLVKAAFTDEDCYTNMGCIYIKGKPGKVK